jgi:hypothetical protein
MPLIGISSVRVRTGVAFAAVASLRHVTLVPVVVRQFGCSLGCSSGRGHEEKSVQLSPKVA